MATNICEAPHVDAPPWSLLQFAGMCVVDEDAQNPFGKSQQVEPGISIRCMLVSYTGAARVYLKVQANESTSLDTRLGSCTLHVR